MASPSRNGCGSRNFPPDDRSFETVFLGYNEELDDVIYDANILETELQTHEQTLNRLAEQYRNPINIGITKEELQKSEKAIVPDWQRVTVVQKSLVIISDTLDEMKINMISFWNTLDRRETEQRSKRRKHRQEIESRRLEIQTNRTNEDKNLWEQQVVESCHQAMIESLEIRVEQCETYLNSLRQIRSKYEDIMKIIDSVKVVKETIYAKLLTVSPLVERNVIAINNKKMRITDELCSGMNEQAGPSGLQQTAHAREAKPEGEAIGKAEEKLETPEADDSQEEKVKLMIDKVPRNEA